MEAPYRILKINLSDLLSTAYLSDVTLVTDDKKHFQAHKIILSACSQFFQNILVPYSVDFSHKPVVFLKGIKEQELTAILQFMYNGQAFFSEERTTQFLEAATTLEVTSIFQEQKKTQNVDDKKNIDNTGLCQSTTNSVSIMSTNVWFKPRSQWCSY